MLALIPTLRLTVELGETEHTLRVPQTNLEELIHVLLFNGLTDFKVEAEPVDDGFGPVLPGDLA